jgi:hypothetical protein
VDKNLGQLLTALADSQEEDNTDQGNAESKPEPEPPRQRRSGRSGRRRALGNWHQQHLQCPLVRPYPRGRGKARGAGLPGDSRVGAEAEAQRDFPLSETWEQGTCWVLVALMLQVAVVKSVDAGHAHLRGAEAQSSVRCAPRRVRGAGRGTHSALRRNS